MREIADIQPIPLTYVMVLLFAIFRPRDSGLSYFNPNIGAANILFFCFTINIIRIGVKLVIAKLFTESKNTTPDVLTTSKFGIPKYKKIPYSPTKDRAFKIFVKQI